MSNRTYSAVPSDFRGAAGFSYIFDPSLVLTSGVPKPITGNWRPLNTATDISNTSITLTGSSFNISNIAVTGGSINIAGGSVAITNPIVPISGIVTANTVDSGNRSVQVVNTAPIPFSGVVLASTIDSGNRSVFVTNPVLAVSGNFGAGGFPTTLLTGINLVGITGGTLNVAVTGGVLSSSSSSIALTGFSPTLPPLPVSGLFTVVSSDTGNRSVQVVNTAPIPVSGIVQAQVVLGPLAVTGFNSTIAPLAVSGVFNATTDNTTVVLAQASGNAFLASVSGSLISLLADNVAITGFSSTIAPLAVSGIVTALTVDTGVRAVNVVNTIAQAITGTVQTVDSSGNLFLASISGSLVTLLADNSAITGFNSTIAPLAISGVVSTTVTIGNVAITGYVNTIDTTGNLYLAAVSGLLAANLAGSAPITGDIRNIPGTVLAISGVVQASVSTTDTGNRSVFVVNQATVNSGGWVGVTGTVAVNNLGGYLGVTGFSSLIAPLAISGVVNTTVSISNVAVTGFPSTIAPLAISGVVNTAVTVSNVAVTGGQMNVAITGGVLSTTSANPVGVTGVAYDRNPIYSGIATYNFLPMGGRVVAQSGIGALTGYSTGSFAMLNMSSQGALYVNQGVLDRNYDQVTSFVASSGLLTTSIVSGGNGPTSAGLVLPNNPARRAWFISNNSTGVLMVRFSATPPTTGTYNLLLKGGSLGLDGNGASWSDSPAVYTGPVSVSGVVPGFVTSFNVWEL